MDTKLNALPIERLAVTQFATDNGDEQLKHRVMVHVIESIKVGDLTFQKVKTSNGKVQFEKWFETLYGIPDFVIYKNEKGFRQAIKRAQS